MSEDIFKEEEYSRRFDWRLWKKLLILLSNHRKRMILLAIVMITVAGIDAIFPVMTKKAIDSYIVPGSLAGIKSFAVQYALLIIIQAVNIFLLISIAGKIDMGIVYEIRKTAFEKLQQLSFSYFDKTPVGWLMARVTSDCSRLGDTIAWGIVDFVWGFTMMIAISVILLFLNWKLALVVLVVVPPLVLVSIYFQKLILTSYRKVRKTNSKITAAFNEGITGAKTTKVLSREERNLGEFCELTTKMRTHAVKAAVHSSIYLPVVLFLGTAGSALALWAGGNGVVAGKLSYGTLVAFISYMVAFFDPVMELARIFAEFQNAQASAERVFSLLETTVDIKDSDDLINAYKSNPQKFRFSEKEAISGDVEFRNVSFSYKEGQKVLDNFSLKVKHGETIALIGETGAGKSTIVNLICRFYEPVSGSILLDGKDYRQLPLSLIQSNIGMVLQTPHLFSGTVKENIRYGRLDATDEEIIRAAKLVNAHSFIEKLENDYQFEVEEGGNALSTGQKQMITFARAVLSNPSILILDEATSSVDTETEQLIQDAIDKLLAGRTSFIIAHRLSTIRSADRILVLENGKIIEEGSHHELINLRKHYYNLYTNQFLEEKENEVLSLSGAAAV